MMYKNFVRDLNQIDLYKDYKQFINETLKILGERLDTSPDALSAQLAEIESRRVRIGYLLSVAKALQDKKIATAWYNKPSNHGATARNKAEVDDEVKEYTCFRNLLEEIKDSIDHRLSLGKKLLGRID